MSTRSADSSSGRSSPQSLHSLASGGAGPSNRRLLRSACRQPGGRSCGHDDCQARSSDAATQRRGGGGQVATTPAEPPSASPMATIWRTSGTASSMLASTATTRRTTVATTTTAVVSSSSTSSGVLRRSGRHFAGSGSSSGGGSTSGRSSDVTGAAGGRSLSSSSASSDDVIGAIAANDASAGDNNSNSSSAGLRPWSWRSSRPTKATTTTPPPAGDNDDDDDDDDDAADEGEEEQEALEKGQLEALLHSKEASAAAAGLAAEAEEEAGAGARAAPPGLVRSVAMAIMSVLLLFFCRAPKLALRLASLPVSGLRSVAMATCRSGKWVAAGCQAVATASIAMATTRRGRRSRCWLALLLLLPLLLLLLPLLSNYGLVTLPSNEAALTAVRDSARALPHRLSHAAAGAWSAGCLATRSTAQWLQRLMPAPDAAASTGDALASGTGGNDWLPGVEKLGADLREVAAAMAELRARVEQLEAAAAAAPPPPPPPPPPQPCCQQQQQQQQQQPLPLPSGDQLPDFALLSAGAYVASTRCTRAYYRHHTYLQLLGFSLMPLSLIPSAVQQLLGLPLTSAISNGPNTALQPGTQLGECWSFEGFPGHLVVRLAAPARLSGVTLDHAARSLSYNGSTASAPRDFSVYGVRAASDAPAKARHLGSFRYEAATGPASQSFQLPAGGNNTEAYPLVELVVHSNHGNTQYTCLYRFRVHGSLP